MGLFTVCERWLGVSETVKPRIARDATNQHEEPGANAKSAGNKRKDTGTSPKDTTTEPRDQTSSALHEHLRPTKDKRLPISVGQGHSEQQMEHQ